MNTGHYIKFGGRDILSPAIVKISFAPVIESLKKLSKDEDEAVATFAKSQLTYLEQFPILHEGFTDQTLLTKYEKQIAKLLRILFPDSLQTNEIKAVTAPFEFTPFFMSSRFKNILKNAGEDFQISVMNFSEDEIYIFICSVILGQVYGYNVDITTLFRLPIPDRTHNIEHVYRVAFNAEMISVVATENAPFITKEDYGLLIERYTDIALWKEKFPSGSYILSGIGILNLMDVTVDQSIAGITSNLLAKSNNTLELLITHIRTIFKKPDLRVGYINYDNDFFSIPSDKKIKSILLNNADCAPCSGSLCMESYEQLIENKKPLVITDTTRYDDQFRCLLSKELLEQQIESYIIVPLVYENDFLGFMEIGSKNKNELSLASLKKLDDVIPILSMALSHFKTENRNEMDAVIQHEFTQIHPAVKWRFEEEAKKHIDQKRRGEEIILRDLDFPDIFPLFGQLDVRGSSTIRNEVIQKDISTQLTAIKNIIARAYHKNRLPFYEELMFRLDNHLSEITSGILAGSEHELTRFLKREIYPIFEHLKFTDKALANLINKYESLLDPDLKVIYNERKKFDQSIGVINAILSEHLDKRQADAQQMFPHYYERYKSDGIEYNVYIGSSIAKGHAFDKIYVQNLRIWQLMVMSELENEFNDIRKTLREPLEIASLIMVHSDSLNIQFRVDEKKFDIKGAYNARYEIIKKRIDKAVIRGTEERITSPGKLTIVYTNEQDADEYIRYLEFLSARGYFKSQSVEKFLLEDLQGITGLQALRVQINYSPKMNEKELLSVKELMQAMESSSLEKKSASNN
ncbi:MAG: hypothetical protein ABIO04_02780 [Ferruginibacter sp.]